MANSFTEDTMDKSPVVVEVVTIENMYCSRDLAQTRQDAFVMPTDSAVLLVLVVVLLCSVLRRHRERRV